MSLYENHLCFSALFFVRVCAVMRFSVRDVRVFMETLLGSPVGAFIDLCIALRAGFVQTSSKTKSSKYTSSKASSSAAAADRATAARAAASLLLRAQPLQYAWRYPEKRW